MNNKKPYVKLFLDIAMGVTFALLFNKMVLGGLAFHEIAGVAIGFAVLVHILLNWKFVTKITGRLFDKSLPGKTRFSYLLNVLLLLSMGFIIISGLLISKVLLPQFRYGNENWFKMSHISISYFTLVLIGVHIGLHWHWVMKITQRLLHLKMPAAAARILMVSLAVVVLAFGTYEAVSTNFVTKLGMVTSVFNPSAAPAGHGGAAQGRLAEGNGTSEGRPMNGKQPANANGQEAGHMEGKPGGGSFQSPNFLMVILTNFGLIGLFTALTYYLDKWIGRLGSRRRRTVTA